MAENQDNRFCRIVFVLPVSEYEGSGEAFLFENVPWGWEEEQFFGDIANADPTQSRLESGIRCTVCFSTSLQADDFIKKLQKRWQGLAVEKSFFEEMDWSLAWKEFFRPIQVGDFFEIIPSWLEGKSGLEPLIIEPKMAFGTGHHATTFLCLQAICELFRSGRLQAKMSFLDLGTGSGILSIAAARLGLSGIGVDIDPIAIENAEENCRLNGVTRSVRLQVGSIESFESGLYFDCIFANILSGPLILMAENILARLRSGGLLVLSGLLVSQFEQVQTAYGVLGTPKKIEKDEWCVLIWGDNGKSSFAS